MRDEEKVCEGNFSYEVSGGSKYVSDDSLLEALMIVTRLLGYEDIKTVGDLNRYYNIYK